MGTATENAVQRMPRWMANALIVMLFSALLVVGGYAANQHLDEDLAQSKDIRQLTLAVGTLAEAVQNLKDIVAAQQEDMRLIRKDTTEQLRETQRLLTRLEQQLDNRTR